MTFVETWDGVDGAPWPAFRWIVSGTTDILNNKGRIRNTSGGRARMDPVENAEVLVTFDTPSVGPILDVYLRANGWTAGSVSPQGAYHATMQWTAGTPNHWALSLWRRVDGFSVQLGASVNVSTSTSNKLRFLVDVNGQIKAKAWDAALAEPTTWSIERTDLNITGKGTFAVRWNTEWTGDGYDALLNDLTVTQLADTPPLPAVAHDLGWFFHGSGEQRRLDELAVWEERLGRDMRYQLDFPARGTDWAGWLAGLEYSLDTWVTAQATREAQGKARFKPIMSCWPYPDFPPQAWEQSTPGAITIASNKAVGPAVAAWRSAQVRARKADHTVSAKIYGFTTNRSDGFPGPGCRMSAGLNGYQARFSRSADLATTRLYLTRWVNGSPVTLATSAVLSTNPVDGATISITCAGSTISATGGGVTIQATDTTFATQDGAGFYIIFVDTPLDDWDVSGLGDGVGGTRETLSDSFNRPDGPLGSIENAGAETEIAYWLQQGAAEAWQQSTVGDHTIVANKVHRSVGSGAHSLAWADARTPDHDARGIIQGLANTVYPGIVTRLVDANNYWLLQLQEAAGSQQGIFKRVEGGFTKLDPLSTTVFVDGDEAGVRWNGTTIEVLKNGVVVWTGTGQTDFQTATKCGFNSVNPGPVFDSFTITGEGVGGACGLMADDFNRANGALGNFAGHTGHDAHWDALAAAVVARGLQGDVIFRPGWEMNGDFFEWWAGADLPSFIAYFRRIVDRLRAGGATGGIHWCPNNYSSYLKDPADPNNVIQALPEDCYPGDAYVDYVGLDVYDYKYNDGAATPEVRWTFLKTMAGGLDWLAGFARSKAKPIILGEWGLWSEGLPQGGGGDDPYYIEKMAEWIRAEHVEAALYFNVDGSGYTHMLEKYPLSYDVFVAEFSEIIIYPPIVHEAYRALGPWAREDEGVGELLQFVSALFNPIVEIDDLVRDTDTHVGWGRLLDVDVAPEEALPWLAQFVGVDPIKGLDAASQRLRIKNAAGFHRGSVEAIQAAAGLYLTGTKKVELYERDGSTWTFRIRTYSTETPEPQKVLDAVTALKPAGLVFVYEVHAGLEINALTGTIDAQAGTIEDYTNIVPV